MTEPSLDGLRAHLARLLSWHDADADYDDAVADLPVALRGKVPPNLPYSLWQLVEHLRLTQADILAYCTRADYAEPKWPDDYWPATAAPPDDAAWDASIAGFRRDRAVLERIAAEPATDLLGRVPSTTKHSLLREILIVVDHNAYHVGQIILVRRLLGAWKR